MSSAPWGAWRSVLLPVGMTGVIVGWIGLRYRRAGVVRLFRPAPSPPATRTARTWATVVATAAASMLVFGLIATWSVSQTARLWPAIVLHATNDAVGVLLFVTAA